MFVDQARQRAHPAHEAEPERQLPHGPTPNDKNNNNNSNDNSK